MAIEMLIYGDLMGLQWIYINGKKLDLTIDFTWFDVV